MAHNTKYLGPTKNDWSKVFNATENTKPIGIHVVNNGAVGYWKPQIRLKKQPIKNVKIWQCGGWRNKNYVDKDVVLLGFAERFFGHFLADSLSRAWIALDKKYKDAQFVIIAEKDVPAFGLELLERLGIKKLMVVKKKTQFRSITIPDSAFDYTKYLFDKKFTDTFQKIANTVPIDNKLPKKIYLSRTLLAENPTLGEEQIQKIFQNNGYTIIPAIQKMSIYNQIALMRNATHIAGLGGTALHQSLFARNGISLVCIHRYNMILPMQILIDKLKNINATYIDASLDPFSKKKNESPVTIVGLNNHMRRFLDDNKFKYNKTEKIDTKNFNTFLQVWDLCHRRLPRWMGAIIVTLVPLRKWRKNMRRKLGLSFQGITRDEIKKTLVNKQ